MTSTDRWDVEELCHSYADAVCRDDHDDWLATWAENGVWNIGRGEVVGRDAIGAAFARAMALFDSVVQTSGSGSVSFDGDRVSGRRYMSENARTKTGKVLTYHGYYDDEYVRDAMGWRFASRRLIWLYQGPSDMSGTFGPPPGYEELAR